MEESQNLSEQNCGSCNENNQNNLFLPLQNKDSDFKDSGLKDSGLKDLSAAIYVKNVYICRYDDNKFGLFRSCDCYVDIYTGFRDFKKKCIAYIGIDSDNIGLYSYGEGWVEKTGYEIKKKVYEIEKRVYEIEKIGYNNCIMYDRLTFNEVRLMMHKEGKIGPYNFDRATPQEMCDVLCYASDYFILKDKHEEELKSQNQGAFVKILKNFLGRF